jgi:hypothetical protein
VVKNSKALEKAIDEHEAGLSLEQKFALLNAMFDEAKELGHFNPRGSLEGIDVDIALAKALNGIVSKPSRKDS